MKFLNVRWGKEYDKVRYGEMDEEMRNRIQYVEAGADLAKKCTETAIKTLAEAVDFDGFIENTVVDGAQEGDKTVIRFANGQIVIDGCMASEELAAIVEKKPTLVGVELEYLAEKQYDMRLLFGEGKTERTFFATATVCADVHTLFRA